MDDLNPTASSQPPTGKPVDQPGEILQQTATSQEVALPTNISGKAPRSKKVKIIVSSLIIFFILATIPAAVYLVQQRQEIKPSMAGSIGQWGCISPKGIKIISQASPGSPGDLGYKPAKSDPTDASGFYDVSKGEVVNFQVSVQDTKKDGQDINDFYIFAMAKVIEAPIGTPITEKTNLSEVQLYDIHYNQGDTQIPAYGMGYQALPGKQPFTIPDGGTATIKGSWTPTECGYYQLDIGIYDFEGTPKPRCPPDSVAAAGFIRVMNCAIPTPTPLPGCWGSCVKDTECLQTPITLVCQPVQGASHCVNPTCPSQENCQCPDLICRDLTSDQSVSGLKEGNKIKLTCTGDAGVDQPINHVKFRGQINSGTWLDLGTASGPGFAVDYTIPQGGSYQIECRVCTSTDETVCTGWGSAGVSSP